VTEKTGNNYIKHNFINFMDELTFEVCKECSVRTWNQLCCMMTVAAECILGGVGAEALSGAPQTVRMPRKRNTTTGKSCHFQFGGSKSNDKAEMVGR
jgi:hypothetical protein